VQNEAYGIEHKSITFLEKFSEHNS